MTPEESEQIAVAGAAFFQNMSFMIFQTGLCGTYMLAFIISMLIILQRENNGWAHKALIALLLAGFTMTVLYTCADIAGFLLQVKLGLVVLLPGGLMAQAMAANMKTAVMEILEEWSGSFIILIADMAIVWRAWALWSENRLIKWTLLMILLTDIGINIADAIVDTKTYLKSNANNTVALDWVSTVLNLTVNIVATLLIAHRAWTHHQITHAVLHNKKTQVEAIPLLMVESGAIFGVVQLSIIILEALDIQAAESSPLGNANFFFVALYIYTSALNPVALVILIQTGNTYEQSFHLEDVPSLEINSLPNDN
ncbi:hypothetical protein BT96DRAFT_1099183 [Gymnopus androsaceus JB14]|uniref:Uncharacterized protein n=1 Tax=Gymnopus androsaceus JB14 TaxID=1447944 RepID=A0A6A4HQL6_9AGAR|nr:hypothetical protein BT96DRAFT_1099183 [Gymnopus androsaceus JB14]